MSNSGIYPTTSIPCPSWCDRPAGHGFNQLTPLDNYDRHHSCDVADVAIVEADEPVTVTLAAMETALSPDGPTLGIADLFVEINNYQCEGMTGTQARQLAAALLNAADEWDRITG